VLTLLLAACGSQEPSKILPAEVKALALNNPLSQQALSLLVQNGAHPDWNRETVEQQAELTVYVAPTTGRPGTLTISLKNGKVVSASVTLVNDQGVATYLDLGGRFGARIRVADKAILEAGKVPDLQTLSATPIDAIHSIHEEPVLPQGYYDPTGCVPDAMYERWIDAQEAYQNAREAAALAAANAARAAYRAAAACATAESGVTAPACIAASADAAASAAAAAYLAYKAHQAGKKVQRIRQMIIERLQQCARNLLKPIHFFSGRTLVLAAS